MKSHATHRSTHEASVEQLKEDAQELLSATAHVAEEKVVEARRRLMSALEKGRDALAAIQEKTVAGAKAADHAIRENPYKSLAMALSMGVIIGYLLRRRN